MRKAICYQESRDWAVILLAAMLAVVLLLFANRAAGDEPGPPMKTEMVVSPWVGVFTAGEYPGAVPYVHVGDRVTPQTIVGMIHLDFMDSPRKVPIYAGMHGTVMQILVEDGSMVAEGQPLMKIKVETPVTRSR